MCDALVLTKDAGVGFKGIPASSSTATEVTLNSLVARSWR